MQLLFHFNSLTVSHMVQWLGFLAFTQAARVRFPVWEVHFAFSISYQHVFFRFTECQKRCSSSQSNEEFDFLRRMEYFPKLTRHFKNYSVCARFLLCSRGRVVKAMDQKSIGIFPRKFESYRLRVEFFFLKTTENTFTLFSTIFFSIGDFYLSAEYVSWLKQFKIG